MGRRINVVFDAGNDTYQFFIDGVGDTAVVAAVDLELKDVAASDTLGKGFDGASYFDGLLDNVLVFDAALSEDEVYQLYLSTKEDSFAATLDYTYDRKEKGTFYF